MRHMTSRRPTAVEHRPWPLPARRWVMTQTWSDLLFAHWPVDAAALTGLLPAGLDLDTFGGAAWLGVVPFRMSGVRLRCLPPVPGTHAFPELNVRTYVTADGKPGVWFLGLDAASPLAVRAARLWFRLPYFDARMRCVARGDEVAYDSERTHRGAPAARFEARYAPLGPPYRSVRGTLEHWLTERYCLYAAGRRGLLRGDIHHAPWPLQPARAGITVNTMAAAAGVALPAEPPLLHFARRLDVLCWAPTTIPTPASTPTRRAEPGPPQG